MIGIVLMSYGSPKSIDDVGEYFEHILNGRSPSKEQLEAVKAQFLQLPTAELLGAYTLQQAEALENILRLKGLKAVKVVAGCKHAPPFIEDAVKRLVAENVTHIITLPMTPLYSQTGVGQYQQQVRDTLDQLGETIPVVDISHWHLDEAFVDAFAKRVKTAVDWLTREAQEQSTVIFTTHSKPGSVDRHHEYCEQFLDLAYQIAKQLQLKHWKIAYRGARPNQEWLGPDVKDVIREEAEKGKKGFVTCDLLSVTTNVEVVHDIGYACQELADSLAVEFVRSEFLNDSADFMLAMANIVEEQLKTRFLHDTLNQKRR